MTEKVSCLFLCLLVLGLASPAGAEAPEQPLDEKFFETLKYRFVGPYRGGRVTAVTGIPEEPMTYFFGASGGGVWKTDDGGHTWENITDGFLNVGSVGAITLAPSDSAVIYVGTGSACPRGNVSIGDGIYRSTDGGETWRHIGLKKAGMISRIRVHPDDPDLVYAAVLGNIFGPNPERGIFRSTDGGATWEKVLFVSERTGAADLSMDENNPRVLFATVWTVQRKPWTLIDGSDEGAVYKSSDGGDTWKQLRKGLPEPPWGRAGVAVSAADPKRIWVIVEAEGGGVFRSDDGGKSFSQVNRERKLRQRAWYYNHIFADPSDKDTVYVLNTAFYKSIDRGKTFDQRIRVRHGDNHDLWVNPDDSRFMINGNDGGANVSLNGGRTWSTQHNQPTAEFYRVSVDNQFPYRVYGAQQDNSTISVPSWSPGGVDPRQHWYAVGGGESGHIAVDPRDTRIVYAGNYIGYISRLDRTRGHQRNVVIYPQMHDGLAGREIRYRFQWNAPIRISPHDPDVLYHTSQYVHRSRDGGQSWETISPDLTTDNDAYQDIPGGPIQHDHTGVELYGTIFAFEESPHQAGELWAGSDDGLVHISRNNGKDWGEITPSGMPSEGTVNTIELSTHAPGRVFVAVYRYRQNDSRPYIFLSNDHGQNWKLLTDGKNGIPEDHFVRVVREDPERPGLLYAGTEFGVYVSFDDGDQWQALQLNLPRTPVTDMIVQRGDLVVATQGRSFWILDDLSPLRQLDEQVLESSIYLFKPRGAYRTQIRGFRGGIAPERPPLGARIHFYLSEQKEPVTVRIRDDQNRLVRTFQGRSGEVEEDQEGGPPERRGSQRNTFSLKAGMNRLEWDLDYLAPDLIRESVMSLTRASAGPRAAPGIYTVELDVDGEKRTQNLEVRKDPRWEASDQDLRKQFALARSVLEELNRSHAAIRRIRSVREQVEDLLGRARSAGLEDVKRLEQASEGLLERLTSIEEALIQTRNESGQDPLNFPPRIDNQIAYLFGVVNGQDALPTEGSYQRYEDLKGELSEILERLERVLTPGVRDFNRQAGKAGMSGVLLPDK